MSDYNDWIERCERTNEGDLIYTGPGKSPWVDLLLKGRELNEIFISRVDCNGNPHYIQDKKEEEARVKKKKSVSRIYVSDYDSYEESTKGKKQHRQRKGLRKRKKTPGLSKKTTRNLTKERNYKYEITIGDFEAEHDEMWIYEDYDYCLEQEEREEYEYQMSILSDDDSFVYRECGCVELEQCYWCVGRYYINPECVCESYYDRCFHCSSNY